MRTGEEEACEAPAMRPIPELHDEPCQQQEPTEAKRPEDLVAAPGEQIRKLARRTLHPRHAISIQSQHPTFGERRADIQRRRAKGRQDKRTGGGRGPSALRERVCVVCLGGGVVRTGEREGGESAAAIW